MASTVKVIGIRSDELEWVRLVVDLLRHPDPVVPELARQALTYISGRAVPPAEGRAAGR